MFCIVANVASDKVFRLGAKVYILRANQQADSAEVTGLSRSGRRIRKFIPYKRLENFRAAWVPPHMQEGKAPYSWSVASWWHEKTDAQDVADKLREIWTGVRFFSKNGERLLQDGETTGMAYKRAIAIKADPGPCHHCIAMDFMVAGHRTHTRFQLKE
jgi:hypothetical protein